MGPHGLPGAQGQERFGTSKTRPPRVHDPLTSFALARRARAFVYLNHGFGRPALLNRTDMVYNAFVQEPSPAALPAYRRGRSRFGFHYGGRSVNGKVKSDVAARVSEQIDKAMTLSGRGLHDAAWERLKLAERLAERAGLSSATLAWGLAATADQRDDAEAATQYIMKALELDEAAPAIRDSHRIICERVVATFKELDTGDPAVPVLFRLLARLGVVDAAVLTKLSRHVAQVDGNDQAALGLAQDAVHREPQNAAALRHLASLLAKVGRHEEGRARRREAEALVLTFPCRQATA